MTDARSTSSSRTWHATALDAAQRAFDLLTRPPAALAFDCRRIARLPQRLLPLDELGRALIRDSTQGASGDQVWRELVTRARRLGDGWTGAYVGAGPVNRQQICAQLGVDSGPAAEVMAASSYRQPWLIAASHRVRSSSRSMTTCPVVAATWMSRDAACCPRSVRRPRRGAVSAIPSAERVSCLHV